MECQQLFHRRLRAQRCPSPVPVFLSYRSLCPSSTPPHPHTPPPSPSHPTPQTDLRDRPLPHPARRRHHGHEHGQRHPPLPTQQTARRQHQGIHPPWAVYLHSSLFHHLVTPYLPTSLPLARPHSLRALGCHPFHLLALFSLSSSCHALPTHLSFNLTTLITQTLTHHQGIDALRAFCCHSFHLLALFSLSSSFHALPTHLTSILTPLSIPRFLVFTLYFPTFHLSLTPHPSPLTPHPSPPGVRPVLPGGWRHHDPGRGGAADPLQAWDKLCQAAHEGRLVSGARGSFIFIVV